MTIQLRSKEDLAGRVAAEVLGACVELASRRDTLKADASIGTTKVEVDRPASAPDSGPEFFTSIFPGLMLFGLMIVSQSMAGLLLRDRASAVDRRLLTLPISNTGVFAGAMLYLAAGLGLLMVFHGMLGATALHVKVEGVPALLAIGFGFVVFISALQLVVGAISPTVRGAQATSAIAVMLLSLLGGAFVPASGYPPALRKVVEMLPNGAAQVGMLRMLGHPGWTNGLSELLVVWSWAIVLSALAFVLYRRRSAKS